MKKIWLGMMIVWMVGCLAGCAREAGKYNKNTLLIKKNGSIVEIAVEDYKDSSVKAEDLKTYIDEQISDYNDEQGKKVVRNESLNTEDMSKVKLVLSYKGMEDYNGFNNLDCILKNADACEEKDMTGTYKSVEDGKSAKVSDILATKKAKVLSVSEKTDVVVKGDILYYNDQVKVKDGIASTTGKENAIIVYK